MSYYNSQDPSGRGSNRSNDSNIPDYYSQDQPSPSFFQAGRPHVQQYAPQSSATNNAYQPAMSPSSGFSPPRSHFANSGDSFAPSQQSPRAAAQSDYTPSPKERHHQIYQQFFQDPTKSQHGSGQWTDDGYAAPGAQSQDQSGLYVPQNNLQALINQMRSRAPLGPPPSARRGPATYYNDAPAVHVITEETPSLKGSIRHGSVRSIDSGDGRLKPVASSYYPSERNSAISETPALPVAAHLRQKDEPYDVSPPNGHERQASVGLKTRPVLTTVKSSDRVKSPAASDTSTPKRREFPLSGVGEREKDITPSPSLNNLKNSSRGPGMYSQSPNRSASSVSSLEPEDVEKKPYLTVDSQRTRSKSPLVPKEILNEKALHKEMGLDRSESGALPRGEAGFFKASSRKLSDRVGTKKPAHLNMAAVREAEGRGSLTSLPDLINRATKLASNLDRGKTASRLGMSAWLNTNEKNPQTGSSAANYRRSAGSLTDMLASFPPPALGTPPESRHGTPNNHYSQSVYSHYGDLKMKEMRHAKHRSLSSWSNNPRKPVMLHSDSDLGRDHKQQQRRCCGMPLWLFWLLLVVGVCLIAVAIIVPIVVVVIPEQQRNAVPAANTTTSCGTTLPCQNGGASIVANNGDCACICANGYSGAACADSQQAECSTISISGASNATVGSSIPRIINAAKANFSIPLEGSKLIGLFSGASLSCASENSLITFNNLSKRDVWADLIPRMPQGAATTIDGLVVAAATSTLSAATAAQTTAQGPAATGSFVANGTTLDFARTAVLYVLQSSGQYSQALSAQKALQNFFSTSSNTQGSTALAGSVALGNGASADLLGYKVQLGLGAAVGGGSGVAST